MKTFIHKHFKSFLIFFSILSLTAISSIWWLSILSIIFFLWNILGKKRNLDICYTLLPLTILLLIFNLAVSQPLENLGNEYKAAWDKTGYDSTYLESAQVEINVISRSIENHKHKYGSYPNSLSDITDMLIDNHDVSYRIRGADGQTNGIPFYYEIVETNKFYLAGVGRDGKIKTDDDLLPQISPEQEKYTGLTKFIVKSFTLEERTREQGLIDMYTKSKKIYDKFYKK
jgi:hypothetical protein